MNRWVEFSESTVQFSTPFLYARHRNSLISAEEMQSHYRECQTLFSQSLSKYGDNYLGLYDRLIIERLPQSTWEPNLSPEYFDEVYQTNELSVDPADVALLLRSAVHHEDRIQFVGDTRITNVSRTTADSFELTVRKDGAHESTRYDIVVNALWQGRLTLDSQLGVAPARPWLHRYKLANRIQIPLEPADLPSVTGVLGPFGDLVNFGPRGLFLSWYPTGVLGTSNEVEPSDIQHCLTTHNHEVAFEKSVAEWISRCPAFAKLDLSESIKQTGGGFIFAWGSSDVDDPSSKLHDRYEIGTSRQGNYYSVDTGKYTTAPLIAFETACSIADSC